MAANKVKAQQFVNAVAKYAAEERKRLGIERDDVTMVLRVNVEDIVVYNEHEDED